MPNKYLWAWNLSVCGHSNLVSIAIASVIDGDAVPQIHQYFRNDPPIRKDAATASKALATDFGPELVPLRQS